MLFAIICIDKPDSLEIRKSNRDAHLAHIRKTADGSDDGRVVQAGPFLDAAGSMCGSLVIFEADEIAKAQAWADGDPYKAADLFQSVQIRPWNRVVGD